MHANIYLYKYMYIVYPISCLYIFMYIWIQSCVSAKNQNLRPLRTFVYICTQPMYINIRYICIETYAGNALLLANVSKVGLRNGTKSNFYCQFPISNH